MDYPINLIPLLEYAVDYTEKICDEFFADRDYVGGEELASFTPIKQVNAFLVRAVFEAWQSEAQTLQSPFFNYGAKDVKDKFNALMRSLSKHVTITRDAFEPILEKAVIDTLRLTFRPTETLLMYLEKLDKRVPIDRLLKPQLKYLKMHPKFIRSIHQAFSDIDEVKRKKLLKKVEKLAKNGHLFDLPYATMQQFNQTLPVRIGELVPNWSDSSEEDEHDATRYTAPIEEVLSRSAGPEATALQQGFEEKATHYEDEDYLPEDAELAVFTEEDWLSEEELFGDEEERPITQEDMKGLPTQEELDEIASSDEPIEEEVRDEDEASIANLFGNEPSLDDIQVDSEEEPSVERVSFSPMEEEVQEEVAPRGLIEDDDEPDFEAFERAATTPVTNEEENTAEEEIEEEDSLSLLEKLQATAQESEEQSYNAIRANSTASKIKGTIPLNLKFRYLNDLFDGDNAAFENAIEIIDESPDYHAAIAVIKEQYIRKYNWDLGEDTTREFLSMISRKFE